MGVFHSKRNCSFNPDLIQMFPGLTWPFCSLGARRLDAGAPAGPEVPAGHAPLLGLGVENVVVGGIDPDVETVAPAYPVHVVVEDAAGPGRAGSAPAAVVLESAAHEVGPAHVHADFVELPQAPWCSRSPRCRPGPS